MQIEPLENNAPYMLGITVIEKSLKMDIYVTVPYLYSIPYNICARYRFVS